MFQQIKWIALSLAVHLAVVTGLTFSASRNIGPLPESIVVILDDFDTADGPVFKASQALPVKAALFGPPASVTEPAKYEMPSYVLQTTAQNLSSPSATRQITDKEPSKTMPEIRTLSHFSKSEDAISNSSFIKKTVSTTDVSASPEKMQQRYLKEHFTYIRDLISKQLVYPPTARRMNWSGKVVVAFVITEAGTAHSIRVLETSGFPILDKCAVETVRSVAPFPRPPVQAEILVPVNFEMMH